MKITRISIRPVRLSNSNLRAFASLTFDDSLVIHDFRVVQTRKGRHFVGFPSAKMPSGEFKEIVVPIASEIKDEIERCVLRAFHDEVAKPGAGGGANGN